MSRELKQTATAIYWRAVRARQKERARKRELFEQVTDVPDFPSILRDLFYDSPGVAMSQALGQFPSVGLLVEREAFGQIREKRQELEKLSEMLEHMDDQLYFSDSYFEHQLELEDEDE